MKRSEYRQLVENWNSFLFEEETRLKRNALLNEAILLNELNVSKYIKKLKRAGMTGATIALAVTAFANDVSAEAVQNNPGQYVSGQKMTEYVKGGNITKANSMVNNGTAETINSAIQSKKELKKVSLKRIGEEIQKIQDEAGGKKVVTYVHSFYSRITLTYLTYLKASPEQIKEIKEKTQELLQYFQGKKFNRSKVSGSFSEKIKKLRKNKDITHIKKLATTVQVFVTCGDSLEKCVKKLTAITKKADTQATSLKLQGTVAFSDGDIEHFVKKHFEKRIFDAEVGDFESKVSNLLNRILDDEADDSKFSDIEITLLEGIMNEDGEIDLDLLDGLSGYVSLSSGGDYTQVDAENQNVRSSKVSFTTKDGKTTQKGIENASRVATSSDVESM